MIGPTSFAVDMGLAIHWMVLLASADFNLATSSWRIVGVATTRYSTQRARRPGATSKNPVQDCSYNL